MELQYYTMPMECKFFLFLGEYLKVEKHVKIYHFQGQKVKDKFVQRLNSIFLKISLVVLLLPNIMPLPFILRK